MELSTKPYLLRAIHDWCTDAGFTPYVAVAVDETVRVPMEFVKNGEIVLNISSLATNRLKLSNDAVEFQARFGGVAREVYVPIARVVAIYARENGQGMAFDVPRTAAGAPAGVEPTVPVGSGPRIVEAPRERASLVPVATATASAVDEPPDDAEPPPPPRPGDRPKLTRIK
ncbi:MAG: ClpXP protease specificity-enhancing factor [Burkholderiaceae bacterium]|jgi:stringent starvation protein B|nr:ClpXP protease specificity-enhancing factor [Burkholderiaceae bacterium]